MQTVTLTTLGPGRNWQKLRISANSASPSQPRSSTMMRRAPTIGPPKPHIDTFRKAPNSAPQVVRGWGSVSFRAADSGASLPRFPPPESRGATVQPRGSDEWVQRSRPVDGWGLDEGALEGRPHRALRVHCIVDQRHHAEKRVDHTRIFAVLDRHGGIAQCRGVALALIVQHIAF